MESVLGTINIDGTNGTENNTEHEAPDVGPSTSKKSKVIKNSSKLYNPKPKPIH